jgi:hypothetical protein
MSMKKLFIASGALGDYNALDKALRAQGFDVTNNEHVLVFLGDMLGSSNVINAKLPYHSMGDIFALYFQLYKLDRAYWVMGEQEKIFFGFLNNPIESNLKQLRKYVVNNNFMNTLCRFTGAARNTFSPSAMKEMQRMSYSILVDLAYSQGIGREMGNIYSKSKLKNKIINTITESILPFLETKNYFLAYGDLSNEQDTLFSNISYETMLNNVEGKIFKGTPIGKNCVVGKVPCSYVNTMYKTLTKKLNEVEFLSYKVYPVIPGDNENGQVILKPVSSRFGSKVKYYINADVNTTKKVNVLVLEDELLPKKPKTEDPFQGISKEELAKRVWNGDFGNGDARKKALGIRYEEVQALVDTGYGRPNEDFDGLPNPFEGIGITAQQAMQGVRTTAGDTTWTTTYTTTTNDTVIGRL